MIKIFTTNTCAYCRIVKKFLDSKGKTYEVINLDDNPERQEEAFKLSGAMTVPITVVDDTDVIIGWNPGRLAAAIA